MVDDPVLLRIQFAAKNTIHLAHFRLRSNGKLISLSATNNMKTMNKILSEVIYLEQSSVCNGANVIYNRGMHILIVASAYPTRQRPIDNVFIHEQALALARKGHQVRVLVAPRIKASLEHFLHIRRVSDLNPFVTLEHFDGLEIYRMHWGWAPIFTPSLREWLVAKAAARAFSRYCTKHGKPDVIHAHNTIYGGYIAAQIQAKFDLSMSVVLTEHNSSFLRALMSPRQLQTVVCSLKLINHILAVGPALAQVLEKYVPENKIAVIGNFVDATFFYPRSDCLPAQPFCFALIARLDKNKGVDILINAFARLLPDNEVILYIAGDGPERQVLEHQVQVLGLQEQVRFLGSISRYEVRDLIWESHVIVSSSHVETFGITLIEAMACGKPVIATRSGGPQMFVNEHNGVLIPPGSVDAMTSAMQRMMIHHTQYNADRIRSQCVQQYGEAVMIERLERTYQEAFNQR